ncbi:hypothetical protein BE21_56280 [Sorangium cellulosum]|uniref:Uncharacterized protein n=1 Tax=Sorangium cellulosum TaxID=56 RepID=A0A150TB73_SORCE|nr:hypothetical protein BE21_56280 [Sorangium cellulosum]
MGTTRTAWHVLLAALLSQRGSRSFEVRVEVPLSTEPLRADYLLLRKNAAPDASEPAGTLRKLWALLSRDAIVEFKSIGRPYRRRNLDRLFSYLHLYCADNLERIEQRSDLSGVLLVPTRTRSLDADVADQGLGWDDLGDGYWRLRGGAFALVVVEIEAVAAAENDDLRRLFGHDEAPTLAARRWLAQQVGAEEIAMAMHDLEGFDEVVRKLLSTLPEQRVAGLPPEQRVAGLPPEQVLLALPDDVLRALSDAYLDTLSAETRAAIRARVGR